MAKGKIVLAAGTVAAALGATTLAAANPAQSGQAVRIRLGDHSFEATLNASAAAREFASMLPITIAMDDLMGREKTGVLPHALSSPANGSSHYDKGDLGYWKPRHSFVIYYRQDGEPLPPPGIVLLGKVAGDLSAFEGDKSQRVTVEPVG
jgi:hypothetical protein